MMQEKEKRNAKEVNKSPKFLFDCLNNKLE